MLLLRYDPTDQVLRSVDDHPGVLGVGQVHPDPDNREMTFYVSRTWMPSQEARQAAEGLTGAMIGEVSEPKPEDITVLTLEELAAGCESEKELATCLAMVAAAVHGASDRFVPNGQFELLREVVDWAIATRDPLLLEFQQRREGAA